MVHLLVPPPPPSLFMLMQIAGFSETPHVVGFDSSSEENLHAGSDEIWMAIEVQTLRISGS